MDAAFSGVRFARANARLGIEIANANARPLWNKGDFFGVRFAPPAMIADR